MYWFPRHFYEDTLKGIPSPVGFWFVLVPTSRCIFWFDPIPLRGAQYCPRTTGRYWFLQHVNHPNAFWRQLIPVLSIRCILLQDRENLPSPDFFGGKRWKLRVYWIPASSLSVGLSAIRDSNPFFWEWLFSSSLGLFLVLLGFDGDTTNRAVIANYDVHPDELSRYVPYLHRYIRSLPVYDVL